MGFNRAANGKIAANKGYWNSLFGQNLWPKPGLNRSPQSQGVTTFFAIFTSKKQLATIVISIYIEKLLPFLTAILQ